jgi:hypothetical protein
MKESTKFVTSHHISNRFFPNKHLPSPTSKACAAAAAAAATLSVRTWAATAATAGTSTVSRTAREAWAKRWRCFLETMGEAGETMVKNKKIG